MYIFSMEKKLLSLLLLISLASLSAQAQFSRLDKYPNIRDYMENIVAFAKENGFDAFTTSLLVSPYQKHDLIRAVGERVGKEEGIDFFYQDFRAGWQEGVAISLEMELYRRPYCGCIFSEKERYWKPPKNAK